MILDNKLEALLRSKKYAALTQEEKGFVSEKMTASEYRHFRLIMCGSSNGLNKVRTAPSPRIKDNLMAAMRAKKAKKRPLLVSWKSIANYRVPAWQAAASVAFLMFCTMLMRQEVVFVENTTAEPLMIHKTDTVFETVYKTDTVFETVPVFLTGKKNVNVKPGAIKANINGSSDLLSNASQSIEGEMNEMFSDPEKNRLLADSTPVYRKHNWLTSPPRGRTAREDSELMQFLTEIN